MDDETKSTANLTPIEVLLQIDEDGTVTSKRIYEFLQLNPAHYARWCKANILENGFAEENVDFTPFTINGERGGQATTDYKLTIPFAKKLCMLQKNECGEQAREYFIKVEEKHKETKLALQNLSPLLQTLITIELRQNEHDVRLLKVESAATAAQTKVDNIRDIVALNPNDWRKETSQIINRIAQNLGGNEHIKPIREESYTLLNERYGVQLKTRLTNKRQRMADEGVCRSKRDKLNYLDVIADDKKLIEGYVSIIKEIAIKYGVSEKKYA